MAARRKTPKHMIQNAQQSRLTYAVAFCRRDPHNLGVIFDPIREAAAILATHHPGVEYRNSHDIGGMLLCTSVMWKASEEQGMLLSCHLCVESKFRN